MMQAKRLPPGGTIGIFCPSHAAIPEKYAAQIAGIKRMGFQVKLGENFYKDTWGYAASAHERADDLNALICDKGVGAVLFNGGNGAAEVLPYIDYESIRRNPKRIGSFSDGTTILNAIHAQTELVVYYGIAPGSFADLRYYDYIQFCSHFVEGYSVSEFEPNSERITLHGGQCKGVLIGGYPTLFAQILSSKFFASNKQEYILFLEAHEKHSTVAMTAGELAFIEQSSFMDKVKGLIFGHFSAEVPQELLHCLERFGKQHNIPVVYTDDYGHGTRHGILPIGVNAMLDADNHKLSFCFED
jgi:muramoyltetrapeptide carboxypeptidase